MEDPFRDVRGDQVCAPSSPCGHKERGAGLMVHSPRGGAAASGPWLLLEAASRSTGPIQQEAVFSSSYWSFLTLLPLPQQANPSPSHAEPSPLRRQTEGGLMGPATVQLICGICCACCLISLLVAYFVWAV